MKALNSFFSARVFFIFASIFFLSQNVMAGTKYEERGLAGNSGWEVKIENIGAYTIDEVTVTVLTNNNGCQMGQSVTRGINLRIGNHGIWYLKSDCQYAVTGKSVVGSGSIGRTTFTPAKGCSITFKGVLGNRYSQTYNCSP